MNYTLTDRDAHGAGMFEQSRAELRGIRVRLVATRGPPAADAYRIALVTYDLRPIGFVRSTLVDVAAAPRQGSEGAPDAWIEIAPSYVDALAGLAAGDVIVVVSWLHLADRSVLAVHPRDDLARPLTGVFATRSQDRPNPIGLYRVVVREVAGARLRVGPLETVDGTPVLDLKRALVGD